MNKFKIDAQLENLFLNRNESALVAAKLMQLINKKDSNRELS